MLTINSRNDKLAAARVDFQSRGMLEGTCLGEALNSIASDPNDTSGDDTDRDEDSQEDTDNHESDTCGPIDGPPILGEVTLALKKGALCVRPVFNPC